MRVLLAASVVAVSVFMLVVASETRTECLVEVSGAQERASLPILSGGRTLHFVENGGRYPAEARYVARSGCLTTWVTDDGFRFSLAAPPPNKPGEDVPVGRAGVIEDVGKGGGLAYRDLHQAR